MGYYIQGPNFGKTEHILKIEPTAKRISFSEAEELIMDKSKAIIIIVTNTYFEAALFAYDLDEFIAGTLPNDYRPRNFLVMDRKAAEMYTNFKGPRYEQRTTEDVGSPITSIRQPGEPS